MRWQGETEIAAEHLGWKVLKSDGVNDHQGWGAHLLTREGPSIHDMLVIRDAELEGRLDDVVRLRLAADVVPHYAVMSWSYGSCGGCDLYEDQVPYDATPERCVEVFGDLIEDLGPVDLGIAEMKFSECKGW